jgi:2-phosphosulfolactate phosphatase
MPHRLAVYDVPSSVRPDDLTGKTVVVIDVLRATTTIAHALEAGAIEVLPCLEIEDARALAAAMPEGRYVLGGERGGLPIDGFHLGNSPGEYTPQSVGGKTVVFTTTNGTRAMMRCRQAARVFLGAFVNVSAMVERLAGQSEIHVVCAGSGGEATRDDVLLAGFLVARLGQRGGADCQWNAEAVAARDDWTAAFPASAAAPGNPIDPESLAAELRKGRAGQRLLAIGLQSDILAASQIDRFRSVPELDPKTMRIGLAGHEGRNSPRRHGV